MRFSIFYTFLLIFHKQVKFMKRESKFQKEVIDEIQELLPDAIIMKNDPNYIQGIPDLTILSGNKWATLEIKKCKSAAHQPNQDYYVEKMNNMSYSAFIFPENKEEVLNELAQSFES